MSSLRKRKKTYYIRFTAKKGNNYNYNQKEKCYSLKVSNLYKAVELKKEIDEYIYTHGIDPLSDYFDFKALKDDLKKDHHLSCEECLELFLSQKNHRSERTKEAYRENIGYFLRFNGISDYPLSVITLKYFIKFLHREGVSPVTLKSNKRHLRAWWKWLIKNGYVENDYISDIELPTATVQYRPKMLSEIELMQLFKTFDEEIKDNHQSKYWREEYAQQWFKPAIATLFYTGCRLHEIGYNHKKSSTGLRADNIIDNKVIYLFRTKRDRERYIPIVKKLKKYLDPYLETRGKISGDDFVFVNWKGFPIQGRTIREQFNKYCEKAGIPSSRIIHGMRHNRITKWLEDGLSLNEAKDLSGHYSTDMTDKVYSHLAWEKLYDKVMRIEEEKGKK